LQYSVKKNTYLRKNANDIKTPYWYFAKQNKNPMVKHIKITFTKTLLIAAIFLGSCAERFTERGDFKHVYFHTNNTTAASRTPKSINPKTTPTIDIADESAENQPYTRISSISPIATPNPGTTILESAIDQTTQPIGKIPLGIKTLNPTSKPGTAPTKPVQHKKAKYAKDNFLNFSTVSNSYNDGAFEWKSILGMAVNILGVALSATLDSQAIAILFLLAGISLSCWGIYELLTDPYDYSYTFISHFFGWLNIILGGILLLIVGTAWGMGG
jgi:hypothetical protein